MGTSPAMRRGRKMMVRVASLLPAGAGATAGRLRAAGVAAVMAALLLGCDGSREPAASGGSEAVPARWRIGMSQCNLGEPWRVQMNEDIRTAAAAHAEIEVIWKDAQNDTLKQRAHIEELVTAGVDVILVSPKEAAPLTEPVARAMEAGIPVIVLDRQVLGADNVAIGRAAGRWLVERLGGRGRIVELQGLMTSTPGQHRHQGFVEGIAGSELEVVFAADMKWLEPNARREMESALARFPEIDAVFAHNDPGAHGAWLAARAAGRDGEMLFVGIDALPHEGVAYVEQGILDASFEYPTGGREAIAAALRILRGEAAARQITLGSRLFTADNAAAGGEPIEGGTGDG